jgi:lactate dehydrogenase-like 2-hydroxyacid dehydrogenase
MGLAAHKKNDNKTQRIGIIGGIGAQIATALTGSAMKICANENSSGDAAAAQPRRSTMDESKTWFLSARTCGDRSPSYPNREIP